MKNKEPKLITLFTVHPKYEAEHCRNCTHREGWDCGTRAIQYCRARKSNMTINGLLKIKCKDQACELFESKDNNQIIRH